jgi:hypothetical protein
MTVTVTDVTLSVVETPVRVKVVVVAENCVAVDVPSKVEVVVTALVTALLTCR